MKKVFFYALAAVAMLSSCSSDNEGASNANEGKTPIKIGVSTNATLSTKGTGTVGGVQGGENNWAGQTINVLMYEKGTLTEATDGVDGPVLFNQDVDLFAPATGSSDLASCQDGAIKYYPPSGKFDFWGFHLDDANVTYEKDDAAGILYANVKIDGSQDLMVADTKALTDEQLQALSGTDERIYSAYSARKGVDPELVFKHLLTRLQFTVNADDPNICEGGASPVRVKAIEVESKTTGKVVLAYTGEKVAERIIFDETAEFISLKQRTADNAPLEALTEVAPIAAGEVTPVGEAMMVAAQESYNLHITLVQNVQTNIDGTKEDKEFTYVTKLENKATGSFAAETSYKVNVKVWGLEKIDITTTLTPWIEGEDIPLEPENDGETL